jgi:hypothetical protein
MEISTTRCRLKAAFRVQGFKARNFVRRILTPSLSPSDGERVANGRVRGWGDSRGSVHWIELGDEEFTRFSRAFSILCT